jgi:hypothetical protein
MTWSAPDDIVGYTREESLTVPKARRCHESPFPVSTDTGYLPGTASTKG